MFEVDLQMFGGGGSKSGLGGGGGGIPPSAGTKTYIFGLYDPRKKGWIGQKFKGRTPEEARKKAEKYAESEGYGGVSEKYKEVDEKKKGKK